MMVAPACEATRPFTKQTRNTSVFKIHQLRRKVEQRHFDLVQAFRFRPGGGSNYKPMKLIRVTSISVLVLGLTELELVLFSKAGRYSREPSRKQ